MSRANPSDCYLSSIRPTGHVGKRQPGSRAEPTSASRGPGTIAHMKIINLLHVVVAQAFYRWAMREINPMHPDVPRIMMRQRELNEKYRQIWA